MSQPAQTVHYFLLTACILTALALGHLSATSALAQSTGAPIFQKDSIAQDIQEARRTYIGQLEEYRTAEREFTIAREQFAQLQTLNSLEEGVQATRSFFFLRDQVLDTYFELLRLEVTQAEGINLPDKEAILEEIAVTRELLSTHQQQIEEQTDRSGVAQSALSFEDIEPVLLQTSERARILLQVGRLQTVYDKSASLLEELALDEADQASQTPTIVSGQQRRALEQTAQTLGFAKQELDDVQLDLAEGRSRIRSSSSGLDSVYATLSRAIGFFAEIVGVGV